MTTKKLKNKTFAISTILSSLLLIKNMSSRFGASIGVLFTIPYCYFRFNNNSHGFKFELFDDIFIPCFSFACGNLLYNMIETMKSQNINFLPNNRNNDCKDAIKDLSLLFAGIGTCAFFACVCQRYNINY